MKCLLCIKILFFGITVIFIQKVYSECAEEENLYQCEGGQKCIPIEWLCDRAYDCPKGDDEVHKKCGSKEERGECEAFHFECIDPHSKKKKCIRFEWKCDGSIDCENGIDEENCEPPPTIPFTVSQSLLPSKNISNITKCKADEFECVKSKECINRDKVCDDKKDCIDASDESEVKCSMPPIKPLIQPKQNVSIETEKNNKVQESNHLTQSFGDKTTTTILPMKLLTTQNLSLNQQNVKSSEMTEKAKTFSTISTLKFIPQPTQKQPLIPINAEKVSNAMINPIPEKIKPIIFTTQTPLTFMFTKSAYSTFHPSTVTPTTKTPMALKSLETTMLEKFNPTTSKNSHSVFSTPQASQERQPLQIPMIIPASNSEVSHKIQTTEKPKFMITYKMSAEAIKEKPQRFSVNSQSNIVSPFSSSIEKLEPIHPKIGIPIIPVNYFQILTPLSALQKENSSEEKSKTTRGGIINSKNGKENVITTVSPIS